MGILDTNFKKLGEKHLYYLAFLLNPDDRHNSTILSKETKYPRLKNIFAELPKKLNKNQEFIRNVFKCDSMDLLDLRDLLRDHFDEEITTFLNHLKKKKITIQELFLHDNYWLSSPDCIGKECIEHSIDDLNKGKYLCKVYEECNDHECLKYLKIDVRNHIKGGMAKRKINFYKQFTAKDDEVDNFLNMVKNGPSWEWDKMSPQSRENFILLFKGGPSIENVIEETFYNDDSDDDDDEYKCMTGGGNKPKTKKNRIEVDETYIRKIEKYVFESLRDVENIGLAAKNILKSNTKNWKGDIFGKGKMVGGDKNIKKPDGTIVNVNDAYVLKTGEELISNDDDDEGSFEDAADDVPSGNFESAKEGSPVHFDAAPDKPHVSAKHVSAKHVSAKHVSAKHETHFSEKDILGNAKKDEISDAVEGVVDDYRGVLAELEHYKNDPKNAEKMKKINAKLKDAKADALIDSIENAQDGAPAFDPEQMEKLENAKLIDATNVEVDKLKEKLSKSLLITDGKERDDFKKDIEKRLAKLTENARKAGADLGLDDKKIAELKLKFEQTKDYFASQYKASTDKFKSLVESALNEHIPENVTFSERIWLMMVNYIHRSIKKNFYQGVSKEERQGYVDKLNSSLTAEQRADLDDSLFSRLVVGTAKRVGNSLSKWGDVEAWQARGWITLYDTLDGIGTLLLLILKNPVTLRAVLTVLVKMKKKLCATMQISCGRIIVDDKPKSNTEMAQEILDNLNTWVIGYLPENFKTLKAGFAAAELFTTTCVAGFKFAGIDLGGYIAFFFICVIESAEDALEETIQANLLVKNVEKFIELFDFIGCLTMPYVLKLNPGYWNKNSFLIYDKDRYFHNDSIIQTSYLSELMILSKNLDISSSNIVEQYRFLGNLVSRTINTPFAQIVHHVAVSMEPPTNKQWGEIADLGKYTWVVNNEGKYNLTFFKSDGEPAKITELKEPRYDSEKKVFLDDNDEIIDLLKTKNNGIYPIPSSQENLDRLVMQIAGTDPFTSKEFNKTTGLGIPSITIEQVRPSGLKRPFSFWKHNWKHPELEFKSALDVTSPTTATVKYGNQVGGIKNTNGTMCTNLGSGPGKINYHNSVVALIHYNTIGSKVIRTHSCPNLLFKIKNVVEIDNRTYTQLELEYYDPNKEENIPKHPGFLDDGNWVITATEYTGFRHIWMGSGNGLTSVDFIFIVMHNYWKYPVFSKEEMDGRIYSPIKPNADEKEHHSSMWQYLTDAVYAEKSTRMYQKKYFGISPKIQPWGDYFKDKIQSLPKDVMSIGNSIAGYARRAADNGVKALSNIDKAIGDDQPLHGPRKGNAPEDKSFSDQGPDAGKILPDTKIRDELQRLELKAAGLNKEGGNQSIQNKYKYTKNNHSHNSMNKTKRFYHK